MDKQEYRLKTEQMIKLANEKSYKEAMAIADSIDWNRVKNTSILCTVSDIYEVNKEYQKAKDILLTAYERASDSKKIIYKLAILSLKLGDIKEAMECYDEFLEVAPKDPNRFVLKYKILKEKNASLEEQIEVLEDFKKSEYNEKWAFELAKLYQEAGKISECLEECDDLILWFSEGKYIYKAMELKMQYKPLTPLQRDKYENRPGAPVKAVETAEPIEAAEPVVKEAPVSVLDQATKQFGSIEEMVQDWQEQQKENAQVIQAKFEKVEAEKAAQKVEEEESKDSILPDDIRKLMEELEAESAEIEAQKAPVEEAPSEEKEEEPVKVEEVQEIQIPAEEVFDQVSFEKTISEAVSEIGPIEVEDGIKLGDTQSIMLSTKSLASAAKVDVPQVDHEPEPVVAQAPVVENKGTGFDTAFVVQGRYDLEAQSHVGLKAGLTEEQKKLFSYFVPVHGMSEQLVKVLHDDKKCKSRYGTSRIGNILVIGRKGSGKTVLAVDIVKAIQKARKMKQGKVAIVTADSLNAKDVFSIVGKLQGGAIIVENASQLNRNTIENLCEAMEGQTGELLVVLEDERKPLREMLDAYPNFDKKFTSQVELPVFINDELVTFGQTYAKENGYKIDEMGILALYSRIDMLQRDERVITVADVKEVVDEAIDNANSKSIKKLMKKVFGKNKDDLDRVLLTEDDFK